MNSYIRFVLQPRISGTTDKWQIQSISRGDTLGVIKWYAPWRQYCFIPEGGCIFNRDCMVNIIDFINVQMSLREKKKVEI